MTRSDRSDQSGRVEAADWAGIERELDDYGCAPTSPHAHPAGLWARVHHLRPARPVEAGLVGRTGSPRRLGRSIGP